MSKNEKDTQPVEAEKSDQEKIVDDHRQMLLMSGKISDFQLENLKKWPFVVFGTQLDKAEIAYNFELTTPKDIVEEETKNADAGSVEFDLYFNTKQDSKYLEQGVMMMEIWTKFLFWEDTKVSFKVEGKKWEA